MLVYKSEYEHDFYFLDNSVRMRMCEISTCLLTVVRGRRSYIVLVPVLTPFASHTPRLFQFPAQLRDRSVLMSGTGPEWNSKIPKNISYPMKFRQKMFLPHENTEKNFRTLPSPRVLHFCKRSRISQILDKKVKIANIYSLSGFNDVRPYTM